MRPFFEAIALYHRYSAPGVENIPHQGRCILAVSHSFATYDAFLLGLAIKKATGRLPVGLGDNLLFNLPGVSTLAAVANLYRANPKNAKRLLEEECLVGVAPGGMREALRSKDQKQQVCWTKRKGFVRLAIQTQSPVVLAACPAADDLYDVYEAYLTKWAYRQYKVPLPVFSGLRNYRLLILQTALLYDGSSQPATTMILESPDQRHSVTLGHVVRLLPIHIFGDVLYCITWPEQGGVPKDMHISVQRYPQAVAPLLAGGP